MFLQPILSLHSWLIDIFPLVFAFSLSCLASMIHQVHQTCQNPLTPLFPPTTHWQNPSPGWMEPSAFFVCAWARTVELLELNYTSPWSMNSRSSTSNGSEYCLALFLQTGFCWHHSTKMSQPESLVILMTLLSPSHSLVFKRPSQIIKNNRLYFQHLAIDFHNIQLLSPGTLSETVLSPCSSSCQIIIIWENHCCWCVERPNLQPQEDVLTLFETKSHSVAYLGCLKYPKCWDSRCEPPNPDPGQHFWVCPLTCSAETSETVSPKGKSLQSSITCPSLVFPSQKRNLLERENWGYPAFSMVLHSPLPVTHWWCWVYLLNIYLTPHTVFHPHFNLHCHQLLWQSSSVFLSAAFQRQKVWCLVGWFCFCCYCSLEQIGWVNP